MKKLLGMIICFCLLLFCAAALAETTGSCGENLTYTLSDEGVLTISGTGDMTSHPWAPAQVTKAVIEEGVTSVANESFHVARNLTEVSFPDSLIRIDDNAFASCFSLQNYDLPSHLEWIGINAFFGCNTVTAVTVPASVTHIGGSAFNGDNLTSVTVESGNENYASSDGVLFDKEMKTLMCYPSKKSGSTYTVPSTVTRLIYNAFCHCQELTEIILPHSALTIEEFAFQNCAINSLYIPAETECIEGGAFGGCSNLAEVEVDSNNANYCSVDGVVFSKDKTKLVAFPGGGYDPSYEVPDGTASIGRYAFEFVLKVKNIGIPLSVTKLEGEAFAISSITDIYYAGTEEQWKAIDGSDSQDSINEGDITVHFSSTVPDVPLEWEEPEYTWADDYSKVTAYRKCVTKPRMSVTEEVVPVRTTSAATCDSAGKITYTATFASDMFTTQTKTLDDPAAPTLGHQYGEPAYTWAADYSTVTAVRVCARDNSHKETETVTATYAVTTEATETTEGVGTYTSAAFQNAAFTVQTVTVPIPVIVPAPAPAPEPVLPVGEYEDPEGTGSYEIEESGTAVFTGTESTDAVVNVPATITVAGQEVPVTEIAANAFKDNDTVKTVNVGENVTSIGSKAFASCDNLKSISGAKNVTTISSNAFSSCKNLTTIKGFSKVKKIGKNAFSSCPKLKSLPDLSKVTEIGDNAFKGDTRLTKVTIGASVKKIGKSAFDGCVNLKKVTIKTKKLTAKNIGKNAFRGTPATAIFKCPKGMADSYEEILKQKGASAQATFK